MRHCSFCSLLCSYESEKELADCPLRIRCNAELRDRRAQAPLVDGHAASFDEAIKASRDYLQKASAVLISGRIVSLEASRAAIQLGKSLGATLDLADSQSSFDWLQAVQAGGCFTTTINEARFRSDLMILMGDEQDFANHPRVLHQLLDCPAPLRKRRLLFLGNFSPLFLANCKAVSNSHNVNEIDSIEADTSDLWQIFKSGSASNLEPQDSAISEVWRRLQHCIEESENVVFVFSTTANYASGVEVYRSLNEYIVNLASDKKVSALPLSSLALMFSQCCTWLSGFPGRIEFIDQVARYNPWLCKADRWIDRTNSDALTVVIDESPAESKISIKRTRTDAENVLVEFSVAASGAECFSTLYKADGSSMIICGEDADHPSAASILQLMLEAD